MKNAFIALLLGVVIAGAGAWAYTSGFLALFIPPPEKSKSAESQRSPASVPVSNTLKAGTYSLEGYSGSLSATPNYRGEVTIAKYGEVYRLEWHIGSDQLQRGIGILDGQVLSVGYIDLDPPYEGGIRDAGAVSFRVLGGGKLEGKWVSIDASETGREVLQWTRSL